MEKRLPKGKIKTRELTKNEKFLLSLLGIVVFFWLIYRFILSPQWDKLENLSSQKIEYQTKVDEMNHILKRENEINKEWDALHKEKKDIVSRYFPKIDQAQIIYLLNHLVENDNLSVDNLNFNRPGYEDIGEFQVKNMEISLPYGGSYEGIIDVLNSLKNSPRKILVDSLTMDRNASNMLMGNISLKVYSLDGIADSEENVVYIDTDKDVLKETPFSAFSDYTESTTIDEDSEIVSEVNQYIEKTLIDFETMNNFFLPSSQLVKGNVNLSSNSKSKKYSLRLEYNILAVEDENRAYVDITKNNVVLKHPPESLGLWVYSYDYSPTTLGLGFKGQMGEDILISFAEGISWTGWKYVETSPPSDLSLYPLKLDNVYLEMPKNRDDFGVLLIDKLEALYLRNLDEDGTDRSIGDYIFHLVEKGESIDSISKMYYGTPNYKNEILKLNEMKSTDILPVGKVLVLKKR